MTRGHRYATLPGMRALFMTWWYPTSDQPGAGVFVREHALAAKSAGVDVAVLHLPDGHFRGRGLWRLERERDAELSHGIPTFRLTSRRIRVPLSRKLSFWASYGLHLAAVWVAVLRLRRIGFKPDLIHAHVFNAGAVAIAVRRLVRLPVVISEHSSMFMKRTLEPGMEKRARYAFARAERVLPVSQALQASIEAYAMPAKFEVVSNAVDGAVFHASHGVGLGRPDGVAKRLLFVGALEPTEQKGFPTLVLALRRLTASHSDWVLDVVGDGARRVDYEAMIASPGLADRLTFLGYRTKPEIADLMRGSELFVFPSKGETQGVVLLEAMMCGLPIVSTTAGAIPEVVPTQAGLLVEPHDDAALAAAIERVLSGEARFDGEAIARTAADRYSSEVVGRKLREIYESVVAAR